MPDEPSKTPGKAVEVAPPATPGAASGDRAQAGTPARSPQAAGQPPAATIPTHPDPTRYGDWEKGGRCIDF